ncbi:MOS1T transposase, partial [Pseudoatta argentina]
MIQKQGHWVPYELKPRTTASTAEKKRFFAPYREVSPAHASTSSAKPNIHGSKRLQLMRLSRALKEKRPLYAQRHDKVILLHDNARPHVAKPDIEKQRHDKVILLHDNARPHVAKPVKTYLETLKWEVLPHPPYLPDIAPSDFHLFRSMAHGLADRRFHSYEEAQKWIDSWRASKDMSFFRRGIHVLPERWEKVVSSDGQYFK